MINDVFLTVNSLLNKDDNGYVSPEEFNIFANLAQKSIFDGYFAQENRDRLRKASSMTNRGYSNLDFATREKIAQFAADVTVTKDVNNKFILPTDTYFIEDDGILSAAGKVVTETPRHIFGYLKNSGATPSATFPVYEKYAGYIKILPDTITSVDIKYLRQPKMPKWTYTVVSGTEMYDPTNGSFQDFEIHPSEFSRLVVTILSYCGMNIREEQVVEVAEALKDKIDQKQNN